MILKINFILTQLIAIPSRLVTIQYWFVRLLM